MHSLWLHFRLLHHQIRTVHRLVSFSDPLVDRSLVVPDATNSISVLCFFPLLLQMCADPRTASLHISMTIMEINRQVFIVFFEILQSSFSLKLSWEIGPNLTVGNDGKKLPLISLGRGYFRHAPTTSYGQTKLQDVKTRLKFQKPYRENTGNEIIKLSLFI